MKIAFTSDNHLQICPDSQEKLEGMIEDIRSFSPGVLCVLGDMGEGTKGIGGPSLLYETLLGSIDDTLYVLGNHDLYRSNSTRETPDISLTKNSDALFHHGIPLEPFWEDTDTVFEKGGIAFVGTIGFCDFNCPGLMPRAFYMQKRNYRTIDPRHIKLDDWTTWTDKLNSAFYKRLEKAVSLGTNGVVISTHYPCFQTHSKIDTSDSVWPYFFNYQLGQAILEAANKYPETKFWCLAGHSHEFCAGKWGMEAENLYAYGLVTSYHEQDWVGFDTEDELIS